jgi:hypothetical protein
LISSLVPAQAGTQFLPNGPPGFPLSRERAGGQSCDSTQCHPALGRARSRFVQGSRVPATGGAKNVNSRIATGFGTQVSGARAVTLCGTAQCRKAEDGPAPCLMPPPGVGGNPRCRGLPSAWACTRLATAHAGPVGEPEGSDGAPCNSDIAIRQYRSPARLRWLAPRRTGRVAQQGAIHGALTSRHPPSPRGSPGDAAR